MAHQTRNPPDWITLSQAATRLGVHPATLRRWADEGEVPALLTPGGHRRFRTADIDRFADRHAPTVASPGPQPEPLGDGPQSPLPLTCFGTNHRHAPTEFRERMMRTAIELEETLAPGHGNGASPFAGIGELVVLTTCNRTELYLVSVDPGDNGWWNHFATEVTRRHGVSPSELTDRSYRFDDLDAARHLFRVACGLDSMVVGESEIAGQVAGAFERARKRGSSGPVLADVFHGAIRTGRRARSETGIGRGAASISSVAVGLGRERLGDLDGRNVLVVGSGKMGRLAAEAFRGLAGARLTIANRTRAHAQQLVTDRERVIGLEDIAEALTEAELVITSTSAPGTIIDKPMVEWALRNRRSRYPIVFVDIAVPRDVDDAVREIDNVLLFGIDDLKNRIDANLAERNSEVPHVHDIIEEELDALRVRRAESEVRPVISALRNRAEEIRQREVERYAKRLSKTGYPSPDDIETLTRTIVHKILEHPTTRLRTDAESYRKEEYERIVRHLFALD